MGDIYVHGLSIWNALIPLTEIRSSKRLLVCWRRLVGKPLLPFLEKQGLVTNDSG